MSLDPQVRFLMRLAEANQEVARDKRAKNDSGGSDFEGVVQANWIKLTDKGAGFVEYNGKEYHTVPFGTKSIRKGTRVNMEFRKGFYITFW